MTPNNANHLFIQFSKDYFKKEKKRQMLQLSKDLAVYKHVQYAYI